MKEDYHKWFSNYLNREFEMLVFGHWGYPVIAFPPLQGRYYDLKDYGLIESAAELIDAGKVKIYCPDSTDSLSWHNFEIHPSERVRNHLNYEALILNDVIDFVKHESGMQRSGLAGFGFGGYHALNIALKHPDRVSHLLTIGGTFDIKPFIFGFYDDECYFNNPPDYLPDLNDQWYLSRIKNMGIIIGTGEQDVYLHENTNLSNILNEKEIHHSLIVRKEGWFDINIWKQMFADGLSTIIS